MIDKILNQLHFQKLAHIDGSHSSDDIHVQEAKNQIYVAVMEVIEGSKVDIEATTERMLEMGVSLEAVNKQEIEWLDTNEHIDYIVLKVNKLFGKE